MNCIQKYFDKFLSRSLQFFVRVSSFSKYPIEWKECLNYVLHKRSSYDKSPSILYVHGLSMSNCLHLTGNSIKVKITALSVYCVRDSRTSTWLRYLLLRACRSRHPMAIALSQRQRQFKSVKVY